MVNKGKIITKLRLFFQKSKFLVNSPFKIILLTVWIIGIITTFSLQVPYGPILITDDPLIRISISIRIFFLIFSIYYLILRGFELKKSHLDIHKYISSKYPYLAYIIIFIFLFLVGYFFESVFIAIGLIFILIELGIVLYVPSIVIYNYLEKKYSERPIHPLRYIVGIGFIVLAVLLVLFVIILFFGPFIPKDIKGKINIQNLDNEYFVLMMTFGSIFLSCVLIFLFTIFCLYWNIRRRNDKSHHKLKIFILSMFIVAILYAIYNNISSLFYFALDLYLERLDYYFSIIKYGFIIIAIILKAAKDINDIDQNKKFDKNYLLFILTLTITLFEYRIELIYKAINVQFFSGWLFLFSIIPAMYLIYRKTKKKFLKKQSFVLLEANSRWKKINHKRNNIPSEETKKKMIKIFRWFIPSILILNFSFIMLIAIFQKYKIFLNTFFFIIDFTVFGLIILKLYKLDKSDKKSTKDQN